MPDEVTTKTPWACCSMHDRSGRRGIWYRTTAGAVEVCAGREGDDGFVRLAVGETLTPAHLKALADCLRVGAWMIEEATYAALYDATREKEAAGETVDWDAVADQWGDNPHALSGEREGYAEQDWREKRCP